MNLDTLKELYVNELRDLYNAEGQLVKALPKMAKAASSDELKEAFESISNRRRVTSSGLRKFSKNLEKRQRVKPARR